MEVVSIILKLDLHIALANTLTTNENTTYEPLCSSLTLLNKAYLEQIPVARFQNLVQSLPRSIGCISSSILCNGQGSEIHCFLNHNSLLFLFLLHLYLHIYIIEVVAVYQFVLCFSPNINLITTLRHIH